jgi:hypothetical protein
MKIVSRLGHLSLLAVVAALLAPTPASASWRANVEGVEFGWTNTFGTQTEYAWARASDATLARLGASTATTLACRAVTYDVPRFAFLCGHLVRPWVSWWINSEGWSNRSHWVAFYPHVPPYLWHGSS